MVRIPVMDVPGLNRQILTHTGHFARAHYASKGAKLGHQPPRSVSSFRVYFPARLPAYQRCRHSRALREQPSLSNAVLI